MTSARRPSTADRELIAQLRRLRVRVTARKLERWRQAGYAPRPQRVWRGYGRGSASSYAESATSYLAAFASEARPRRPLFEVALTLFSRGIDTPESVLRVAYTAMFDRMKTSLGTSARTASIFDLAERFAQRAQRSAVRLRSGRFIRRRLGQFGETSAVFITFLTNCAHILIKGRATSDEALTELVEGSGLSALATDSIAGLGPIAPNVQEVSEETGKIARLLRLDALVAACRKATKKEFEAARDDYRTIVGFWKTAAVVLSATSGLPGAFGFALLQRVSLDDPVLLYTGTAAMLVFRERLPDELAEMRSLIAREGPRYAAMGRLLPLVPRQYHHYFRPDGMARLAGESSAKREEVLAAIRRSAVTLPDDALLLAQSVS